LNEASSSGHVSKSAQRLKPNASSGNTRVLIQPIAKATSIGSSKLKNFSNHGE
jgi:hypothetical protein